MQAMIESPLGYLTIVTNDDGVVTELVFENLVDRVGGVGQRTNSAASSATSSNNGSTTNLNINPRILHQLEAYFDGTQQDFTFDWDLSTQGTPFQQAVWEVIAAIPYGQVMSYKEIAETIGKPRAYRAVANACGRNPLPIVVPCHRVVGSGSNGSYTLGGYSSGLERKRQLMAIEKIEL